MKIRIPVNQERKKDFVETGSWMLAKRILGVSYYALAKRLGENLVKIDNGLKTVLAEKPISGKVNKSDVEVLALGTLAAISLYSGLKKNKRILLAEGIALTVAFGGFLLMNGRKPKRKVIPN